MKKTKRYQLLCLVVAGIAAGACSRGGQGDAAKGKAPSPASQPDIKALEPVFDFGKVKQGVPVEHVFKITNVGKADLAIKQATGS